MTTADPLIAANPLPDDAAARLAIGDAEDDMLARIVMAAEADRPDIAPASTRAARPRRLLAVAGLAVAALPVIAVLAVVPTGRHARTQPVPPAGQTASRPAHPRPPADASPLVLLVRPGWRVWYADEQDGLDGEVDFGRDSAASRNGAPVGGPQLHWYPAREARGYIQDRASEAAIKTTVRVLGAAAHVIQYKDTGHGPRQYSAIWTRGSRVFELRDSEPDMAAFKAQLARLRVVDYAAWLKAMPRSVVTPAQRGSVIHAMLRGIPVPPGFSVRQIPGQTLVQDRYQLGAAVTGVVACEWFARWGHARTTGNQAVVNQAFAAMSTATRWPVLKQMSRTGAWPSVLIGYAKDMRTGRSGGHPLLGDVDQGLGCSSEWHVKLPGAKLPGGPQPAKSGA